MSSPKAYAWHEYPLIIEVTSSGGNLHRFLAKYKTQDEVIAHVIDWLADRGRSMMYIKAEELLEESYDLLVPHFGADTILE